MRESLAHALGASLEWDDSDHERAIDKVTAFSQGKRLGTLLWRVKYKNCVESYKPTVLLLAKKLDKSLTQSIKMKIAEQALKEWLFPFCEVCHGARDIKVGELVIMCKHCAGSGIKKYSDDERRKSVGIIADRHINYLQNIIGEMDIKIALTMHQKLSRNID